MHLLSTPIRFLLALGLGVLLQASAHTLFAAVEIQYPLARNAYQTNERIDLAVVRSGDKPLAAGNLMLTVLDEAGGRMAFVFSVEGGQNQSTEHLHLSGWLLRPGHYKLEVAVDGANATNEMDVFSHVRKSSYKLINWGRADQPAEQLVEGEDNLGFNLFYGHYGVDQDANFLRAGLDYMPNCVMSGGHQMDLRMECDWSDPYVVRGGTRRVVRSALSQRTRPNVTGIHFYDEPGLTWWKDTVTGEFTPHMVPAQVRSYKSAFGRDPLHFSKVNPQSPADVAAWRQWARWKLGFMDAAWQDAQFGVSYVNPNLLSVTQSQYGFSAFTDGYYFNVVRSLPVTSGHGGYHDWGPGFFNPSFTLEMARARDLDKPCWYLPAWYGNTTGDVFRLEQYLSFQTNIQGMMSPPDLEPSKNPTGRQGIVESNKLMGRLGPVFDTLPVTRPPVAMLYSLSNLIQAQTEDRSRNYAHSMKHGSNVPFIYVAGKLLQHQFLTITDEDIIDGNLATDHKAVILTSIDYLDPAVVTALEEFAANGGLVLLTSDCAVKVNGGVNLGVEPGFPDAKLIAELQAAGKGSEVPKLMTLEKSLVNSRVLAAAIKPHLEKAGIFPAVSSDQEGIAVTRQADGDVEYLFAVNATLDAAENNMTGLQSTGAKLSIAGDDRPVYDALAGMPATEFTKQGDKLTGDFRFGPGQMRVFARTTRPIGAVRVAPPQFRRELTREQMPLWIEIAATVLDDQGNIVGASLPLEVTVTDAAGVERYKLHRASDQGLLTLSLPLAANDPAGQWKVSVKELLAGTEGTNQFTYKAARRCGPAAGASPRAITFGNDRTNIKRFFRVHQAVTVVVGKSDFDTAAAQRLVAALDPWDVRCTVVDAEKVNKARPITEEESKTWVGLAYAGSGQIKPGDGNTPGQVGFDVRGPVVLIGSPEDNPLIEFLLKEKFLPYEPKAGSFPGTGRGLVAWQRDAIGAGQESLALIAYDAAGIEEAVGTVYEAAAALDDLTPLEEASNQQIEPATKYTIVPDVAVAWEARLPDRIDGLQVQGDAIVALSHDGTEAKLDANGKTTGQRVLDKAAMAETGAALATKSDATLLADATKRLTGQRMVKFVLPAGNQTAVACWGGHFELASADGKVTAARQFEQDITALAVMGNKVLVGLADGRVVNVTLP